MFLAAAGYFFWASPLSHQDQKNYIEKYKGLAIKEMERTGIPASITMAQALLESNSGKSDLARRGNNHFGIKCHSSWTGGKVYKKDDDYRNGKLIESCFRAYPSVEGSYRDHSDFLVNGQRYDFLFDLSPTNYQGWARGLKKAGYATSQYYHKKLISLIETHHLYELDKMSSEEVPVDPEVIVSKNPFSTGNRYLTINDVKYVLADEGESLEAVADRVRYSSKRLLRYNEGIPDATFSLDQGDVVFIQPKRRQWRGRQKYHTVTTDETMYDIAQRYGIDYHRLYRRNRMRKGDEPAEGARIKIRGCKADSKPALREKAPLPDPDGEELLPEVEMPGIPPPDTVANRSTESRDPFSPAPEREGSTILSEPVYHVVSAGETLLDISRRYDVPVDVIREFNALGNGPLERGMRLRIK